MGNDLAIIEALHPLAPKFAEVLGNVMTPERFIRTVAISAERTPDIAKCERQSLFNAVMTFAVLGLEVDGVTGQGFLIPFKDNNRGVVSAQAVIGYLGYNTLGARAGYSITGRVVREGDDYWCDEARGVVHHRRKLGGEVGENKRRIIAAWARASSLTRPPVVRELSIDELLAVKAKSPGARRSSSPWNDTEIGFPAMCEKTAKRRLRRDMPLNVYQQAAAMEEQHEELGRLAWIHPQDGVMTDAGSVIVPSTNSETPSASDLLDPDPKDPVAEATAAASRGTEMFRAYCRRWTKSRWAEIKAQLDMPALQALAEAADRRIATEGGDDAD